jgi:hypothetical protein
MNGELRLAGEGERDLIGSDVIGLNNVETRPEVPGLICGNSSSNGAPVRIVDSDSMFVCPGIIAEFPIINYLSRLIGSDLGCESKLVSEI